MRIEELVEFRRKLREQHAVIVDVYNKTCVGGPSEEYKKLLPYYDGLVAEWRRLCRRYRTINGPFTRAELERLQVSIYENDRD